MIQSHLKEDLPQNSECPRRDETIMHANPRPRVFATLPTIQSLTILVLFAITAQAGAQKLVTFDAPNSSANPYQGTEAAGINIWGTIVGDVTDSDGGVHGFARTADGKFTEFDVLGANPAPGYPCLYGLGGTCPTAISDLGVIVGFEGDANDVFHGFVRTPDGKITVFDAPGAATTPDAGLGTWAYSINNLGVVTGYYADANYVYHGYVRTPDGKITVFDDAAAGTGAYQGTFPESINNLGAIAGWVTDENGFSHGTVRSAKGKISTFDPPGDAGSYYGVETAYINDLGLVGGGYWQGTGNVSYGFEGMAGGTISTFQIPDAGSAPFDGAYVSAINMEGAMTGYVTDSNVENHSFVRSVNGKVAVFDVPGQELVPNSDFGSAGEAINALGVVAGRWHDTNAILHAYVWVP